MGPAAGAGRRRVGAPAVRTTRSHAAHAPSPLEPPPRARDARAHASCGMVYWVAKWGEAQPAGARARERWGPGHMRVHGRGVGASSCPPPPRLTSCGARAPRLRLGSHGRRPTVHRAGRGREGGVGARRAGGDGVHAACLRRPPPGLAADTGGRAAGGGSGSRVCGRGERMATGAATGAATAGKRRMATGGGRRQRRREREGDEPWPPAACRHCGHHLPARAPAGAAGKSEKEEEKL
jgi:hypothetical protein